MIEWPKINDAIGTVNRGNPAESGLCTLCRADCKGLCPSCGTNLNRATCDCTRQWEDPRFAALKELRTKN